MQIWGLGHIDPGLKLASYCMSSGTQLSHIQQGQEEYLLHRVIMQTDWEGTESAWYSTRLLVYYTT